MLFLASMGKTGLTHDIFFKFSVGPFEFVEAEGGRLVKEVDFEAEKKILQKKNSSFDLNNLKRPKWEL